MGWEAALTIEVSFRVLRLLGKFLFFLDRLAPSLLSFFLKRILYKLVNNRTIARYRLNVDRIKRFHYRVNLEVDLDREHLCKILHQQHLEEK